MSIPHNATPRSHALFAVASELADACPPQLGAEIALAGSVSRGWADEHSDIELNVWVDKLEWSGEREAWLRSLNVERMIVDQEAHETGSWWIEFIYKDVWVEAGWHSFDHCDALLRRIIAGEVEDMFEATIAEALHHSILLRNGEHLHRWRAELETYPDALRKSLIELGTRSWRDPRWLELYAARMARPDPLILLLRHETTIRSILRILFAINRQWQPDLRKWTDRWAATLDQKPQRLAERALVICERPLARESYSDLLDLIAETLALIPPPFDVTTELSVVNAAREALRAA
jgi:hypothetical protein